MKWKVQKSSIHGNGVFASTNLKKGEDIGVSLPLVNDDNFVKVYQRNTFGLLINDSKTPNAVCQKINGDWHFVALQAIKKDEEICVDYSDYEAKIDMDSFISNKKVIVI